LIGEFKRRRWSFKHSGGREYFRPGIGYISGEKKFWGGYDYLPERHTFVGRITVVIYHHTEW